MFVLPSPPLVVAKLPGSQDRLVRGSHGQLEHDRTETVLLSRPYHTEADQLQQSQERHYHVCSGRVRCEHAPELDPFDQVEVGQDEPDALPDGEPLPLDLVGGRLAGALQDVTQRVEQVGEARLANGRRQLTPSTSATTSTR